MRTLALVCSMFVGASVLSFPAVAQQKTVKACQQEWRANKAANQAKGITEKAYVAQCRAGAAAAAPAPAAPTAAAPPKVAPSSAPASSRASRPSAPTAPSAATPSGAYQYSTEGQAKVRCGPGTVVWVNLNSKIYHFVGHKDYGHTKSGAFMCERDAMNEGMRAAKNEKHP